MADLREDLPYRAEYAKTGRAACKACKDPIAKDSIRLAVMVQSPFFDGKQPNWHHFDCFFARFRPKLEEIAHLTNLKYEDQKKVEKGIESAVGVPVASGKSKKNLKKKVDALELSDFKVEYAKSNRSKCRLCEDTIVKSSIRISKLDRESTDAMRFGPLDRWFHVECFVSARDNLEFYDSADKLPFFDKLNEEDQKDLKKKLPPIKKPENDQNGSSPPKKMKLTPAEEKKLKKQSDLLFKYRELAKNMKKSDLLALMEKNKIEAPESNDGKYDRLADAMAFGVPEKCPECKKGQLVFRRNGYICTGNITEWSKCEYQTTENPKRKPFKVPKDLAEVYPELGSYKYKESERLFNPALKQAIESSASAPSTSSAPLPKKEEANGPTPPLNGYNIVCVGKFKSKSKLKSQLKKLGANPVDEIDRTTLCVISTKAEYNKKSKTIIEAKEMLIPVVSEEFVDGVENGSEPIQVMGMNRLDDLDIDVEKRFNNLNVKERMKSAFKSGGGKSGRFEQKSGKQKMVLKDGNVVDPDCEVADVTHILKEGDCVYNTVLSQVDLSRNKNSYYKMQLLQHDSKPGLFYLFRSWGRVGTTIGGTCLDKYTSKQDAIKAFEDIFEERTQNKWKKRKNFKKKPDCYYPVDIDYGGDDHLDKLDTETSKSNLPKPVQDLICMIFDVQKMKEQMLEFELDLEKMPLGKLSKKQLLKACSVLKELSQLIDQKPPETVKIKDATNRFYTLIPHNFGTEKPPLIDSEDMIKTKMDMLESLLDIEMAYEMINSSDETTKNLDPIDHHYQKLNAVIEPLPRDSEEFAIIEKYLKNTHGPTHSFQLEIEEVFKVQRNGEYDMFKKHKDLDRMLLWHGSRVTNFAGILSQGLRIAPPEAPVTGYMFGKGIYFADMATKSAGYCHHHTNNNTGLLLLSEVAVGNPWELYDAKDVTKLPKDKHSVKGVGKTTPDPNEWHVLPDGLKVPLGKGVDHQVDKKCSLLYNEYIVYKTSQVNIKYLLKCKFNSKSLF